MRSDGAFLCVSASASAIDVIEIEKRADTCTGRGKSAEKLFYVCVDGSRVLWHLGSTATNPHISNSIFSVIAVLSYNYRFYWHSFILCCVWRFFHLSLSLSNIFTLLDGKLLRLQLAIVLW